MVAPLFGPLPKGERPQRREIARRQRNLRIRYILRVALSRQWLGAVNSLLCAQGHAGLLQPVGCTCQRPGDQRKPE